MTPRLPSMTAFRLVRILEQRGSERVRQSGSHLIPLNRAGEGRTSPDGSGNEVIVGTDGGSRLEEGGDVTICQS